MRPSDPFRLEDMPARRLSSQELAERLERLIGIVCQQVDMSAEELKSGSRRRPVFRAREVVSYMAVRKMGMSGAAVARVLNVRTFSVLRAAERGLEALKDLGLDERELML
jgi:chromosomal replication initiation ATPase DnaA